MRSLTFYLLIHTLAWGAVGAVIAQWARVPRWLGAAVVLLVALAILAALSRLAARKGQVRVLESPSALFLAMKVGIFG